MGTIGTTAAAPYALGRSTHEYERLRAQARVWHQATEAVLDRVGVPAGARALDAGCGPGETMRSLADRVGPSGRVIGVDLDVALGAAAQSALQADGYDQCHVIKHDLTSADPPPGGPFDVVLVRIVLFHLPQRATVLGRLWRLVAPGGVLIVQDYALGSIRAIPDQPAVTSATAFLIDAFEAAGCDVDLGLHLADLFAEAGIGAPDATDVVCRVDPLPVGAAMLDRTCRSVLPGAVERGVTTQRDAEERLRALATAAAARPSSQLLWPLLGSAWKQHPGW